MASRRLLRCGHVLPHEPGLPLPAVGRMVAFDLELAGDGLRGHAALAEAHHAPDRLVRHSPRGLAGGRVGPGRSPRRDALDLAQGDETVLQLREDRGHARHRLAVGRGHIYHWVQAYDLPAV